jgi:hypothetical protein
MTDKIFASYDLESNIAANRPVTPTVSDGRLYIFVATDTHIISIWDGTQWQSFTGIGAATALFITLVVDQSVTDNVVTVILFDTVSIDTLSGYNAANGRFTPTKSGTWFFFSGSRGVVATAMGFYQTKLRKNGTDISVANAAALTQFPGVSAAAYAFAVITMNGTTDYIDITGFVSGTGGSDVITGSKQAFIGGFYIGP